MTGFFHFCLLNAEQPFTILNRLNRAALTTADQNLPPLARSSEKEKAWAEGEETRRMFAGRSAERDRRMRSRSEGQMM
jgi:hypothetical protein